MAYCVSTASQTVEYSPHPNAIAMLYHVPKENRVVATRVIGFTPFTGCAVCFETEVFIFPGIFTRGNGHGRRHDATAGLGFYEVGHEGTRGSGG